MKASIAAVDSGKGKRATVRTVCLGGAAALALASSIAPDAAAQSYPSKPVTLVVPVVAGSALEVTVRAVSAEAGKTLGQNIVVENRPGANQRLSVVAIKAAAPDGYVLGVVNDTSAVTHPLADPSFQLEAGKDYEPVAFLVYFPLMIAAHQSVPFRDVKGMVAYAKNNPKALNVVGAPGTITHLTAERIRQAAGFEWTTVPYKDSQQAMPDLLEGRVQVSISGVILKPGIDSGKLIALATTGTSRWNVFPDVPTLQEAGLNVSSLTWFGVFAPGGTPLDVRRKLNAAFNAALKTPELEKRIRTNGYSTGYSTVEQFGEFLRAERAAWGPVIKAAGIKIE